MMVPRGLVEGSTRDPSGLRESSLQAPRGVHKGSMRAPWGSPRASAFRKGCLMFRMGLSLGYSRSFVFTVICAIFG